MATASHARLAFPALILGSSALAVGPLLVRAADVSPVASAFWRLALAVPFLLLMARLSSGPRPATGKGWAVLGLAGLFFAADIVTWHGGIVRTTVANSTLFGNVSSFFFAAYGFWIARAWPDRRFAGALAIAVAGMALLMGRSFDLSPRHFAGDLLCVLAAMLYTGYLVIMDRERARVAPMPALAAATAAGALGLLPVALLFGQPVWPGDWPPLVALALGSQVFGQGLIIYAVGHLRPEISGLGLLSQPVVAAFLGWAWAGEALGAVEIVGGLMVLGALVLARWPARSVRAAPEPVG